MKFDDMPSYSYSKHLDILDSISNRLNAMNTMPIGTVVKPQKMNSDFEDEEFFLF